MGRFDDRATQPSRGPGDMFAWKILRRTDGPRRADFQELDAIRPGIRDGAAAAAALASPASTAVWIGHATWAVRIGGLLVVIDPVWSASLSGVVPRLVAPGIAFDGLPDVDVVLVTHDHRDHMDLPTLRRLGDRPLYVVPLGNGPRIAKLGGNRRVVELDWWQTHTVDAREVGGARDTSRGSALDITLVPARHWSMREPWNKNATLWGGYIVRGPEGAFYHSGDTAYGDHFAEIAARANGPIDWAMLPIGGYSPRWFMEPQHVDPVEAARGFAALGARHMLAMHWGTFRLTDEAVGEPPAMLREYWAEHRFAPERLWLCDVGEIRALR